MVVLLKENAFCVGLLGHLSVWNRWLVDFKQMNEAYGGDLHENGCFIEGKRIATRRTLAWWHSSCSFICLKSNIGRFQTDKWTSGCAAEAFICLISIIVRFQTDKWAPGCAAEAFIFLKSIIGRFQKGQRVDAECFSLSCSVISLKSIIGRSLVDHWSISKRYVSGWGAILKKMAVFNKENAFCVNGF